MSVPKPNPPEPRWMSRLRRDFVEVLNRLSLSKSPLMIAISGGADSVALTMLLTMESDFPLVLAHFNHGLRGDESDQDSHFVCNLAKKLELNYPGRIRYFCGNPTTPLALEKGNLEANSRVARYSWLVEIARELGCESILTGHHAEDQAETVLFHILRGTGPLGLKGIAAKKKLAKGVNLIRPLLEFSPELLRRYLDELGQPFRVDSSNQLGSFTRNRLRREILPQLSEIMGRQVSPNLTGIAWHARNLHKKELVKLKKWVSIYVQFHGPTRVSFPVGELKKLGNYSAMGMIGQIAKILNWPRRGLSRNHYKAFWNQILNRVRTISLPGGLTSSLDVSEQILTLCYSPTGSTQN